MAEQGPRSSLAQPLLLVAAGALLGALCTLALVPSLQGRALAFSWLVRPKAQHVPAAAVSIRDRLPWEPMLTAEEVQRALGYYGSGSRMRRVAAKLLAGQPIKVVLLGGSITRGTGASRPGHAYASRFFQALNASFPHPAHELRNSGLGAATSTIFAGCTRQLVPPGVDLAVLEFTCNENAAAGYSDPPRRAFEQLLRRLLALPGPPALLLLHHYAWFMTHGDGLDRGLFYYPPEAQLTTFANYYDFPVVSMRSAVWRLMQAGVEGFRTDRVVPIHLGPPDPLAAPPGHDRDFYYADAWVHPSDSGHQAMAEALTGPLQRALDEVAAAAAAAGAAGAPPDSGPASRGSRLSSGGGSGGSGSISLGGSNSSGSGAGGGSSSSRAGSSSSSSRAGSSSGSGGSGSSSRVGSGGGAGGAAAGSRGEPGVRRDARLAGLPPPMIPGNTGLYTISCAMQQDFEAVVRDSSGFEYRPERPNATDFTDQKWGWSAYEPGDWAELELDTRAPADSNLTFGVYVWLSHLKSYEHMGSASVERVAGCTCQPARLSGRSDHRISVPTPLMFPVSQHEACRIRVTVLDEPGQTGEHKVVLFAAVVLFG